MSFKEIANASTMFLLRGLGLNVNILNPYGFISAYVDDINHDIKYESAVFLLFKPDVLENLQKFIKEEYKKGLLKEDYDYEDGWVVMVYTFPEQFLRDYERFLMGEYSKFSPEYKALFPEMVNIVDEDGKKFRTYDMTYHIFTKSDPLREYLSKKMFGEVYDEKKQELVPEQWLDKDAELWSSPYLDGKDVLDIDRIRKELLTA